mmetsp:Transcript_9112/g.25544  ORF Transcript_9112/g.25544 Transcript_9112/m.25544 type:complete len:365 (-) Transcript_9112:68-1162(-)|eukprot:CAMPEP_0119129310 /NCGR_PEP_ID=MMETSP1310-20130426/7114_1 /TAXON_ID=464262 /ORGANISM="Genus nov. species nov., Strain RCC2339" /LENGTH=364 /DNA_ID=CAMNT_0007119729 /DNA_START=95 /DNA_END=1189 /DNA_ORIENTATION=-
MASEKKQKVALITGITGQDGSYLAELLLSKGYEVHGIIRRCSTFNTSRIDALYHDRHVSGRALTLHYGDLSDSTSLISIFRRTEPDEVYNLAAQSHVKVSFEMAEYTADVDAVGALRLLDAIRTCNLKCKFYQASSSEMFGDVREKPQRETTPFYPRSPYACAKVYAYWIVVNYREAYNIYACNGILFNHESPRRGPTFVTRKITRAVVRIVAGVQKCLYIGNLEARRDWGHAKEYVEAMWMMLQQDKPDDYVIGTGNESSVRDFVNAAFSVKGITIEWEGEGENEVGKNKETGDILIRVDPRYFRPTEVNYLCADPSKAERQLKWKANISLQQLVEDMVVNDDEELRRELYGSTSTPIKQSSE